MTLLLDDKKVREYFDVPTRGPNTTEIEVKAWISLRILDAMQQPIKKGERYLQNANGEWREMTWELTKPIDGFHGFDLRLPDRFQPSVSQVQKKECECNCCKDLPHLEKNCHHASHLIKPHPAPEHPKCDNCGIFYPSDLHKEKCTPKPETCDHAERNLTCGPECKPDSVVEEKIKALEAKAKEYGRSLILVSGDELRELVALARSTK